MSTTKKAVAKSKALRSLLAFRRTKTRGVVTCENGKRLSFPRAEDESFCLETLSQLVKEFSDVQKRGPDAMAFFAEAVGSHIDSHVVHCIEAGIDTWESEKRSGNLPVRAK